MNIDNILNFVKIPNLEELDILQKKEKIEEQIQKLSNFYKDNFNIELDKKQIKKENNLLDIEYQLFNNDFQQNKDWKITFWKWNSDFIFITWNRYNIPILEYYNINYIVIIKWFINIEEFNSLYTKLYKQNKKIILEDKILIDKKLKIDYSIINNSIDKVKNREDLIKQINDNTFISNIKKEFEIINYEDTLKTWLEELAKTNKGDVFSWGYDDLDEKIWYIKKWELILVGWTTWTWKSTFVNNIAKKIWKSDNKVLKFTLEDRLEDKKKQEYLVELNKILRKKENRYINYNDFISNNFKISEEIKNEAINNLIKDNKHILEVKRNKEEQIKIDELEEIVKQGIQQGCNIIIIDHLQEFNVDWAKERQDLKIEEVMYKIKNITRKYNVLIFLIAHFKKIEWKPSETSFKDSMAISQVANKVLLLYRDKLQPNSETELIIAKNREKWKWTWTVYMQFDFDTLQYTDIKIDKDKLNWNFDANTEIIF